MSTGAELAILAAAAETAPFKAFRKFLSNEFVVLLMRVRSEERRVGKECA